jgi:hypothetical protein
VDVHVDADFLCSPKGNRGWTPHHHGRTAGRTAWGAAKPHPVLCTRIEPCCFGTAWRSMSVQGVVGERDDEDTGPTPWLIYRWSQVDRRIFTVVHSPGGGLRSSPRKVGLIWSIRSPYYLY